MRRGSLIAIALALVTVPLAAHAQGAGAAAVDEILGDFQGATAGWLAALQGFARNTFALLALIQLAWAFAQLAITRAGFDAFLSCLVREIMMLGLFWFLLEESTTFGPLIINSFRQAATSAGGGTMSPGDVLDAGIDLAGRIMGEMSVWSPTASVGLLICALLVGCTIALVCASMVVALVESYFVVAAGVLMMAFGGSQFTNEIAISVVRTVFAIGAKLFALQLIASIGIRLITEWVNKFHDVTSKGILIEISMSLVLLTIVRSVPGMVERMAGGHGMGAHAGALFGTASGVVTSTRDVVTTAGNVAGGTVNATRSVATGTVAAMRWGSGGQRQSSGTYVGGSRSSDLGQRFSGGRRS